MNPNEQNFWQAEGEDDPALAAQPQVADSATEPITWEASEYIHHQKSFMWYLVCVGLGVISALLVFFLLKSWTFSALIIVLTVAAVVYGARPPRTLSYALTATSLKVNDTPYSLSDFRSFGVIHDGPLYSVALIPAKRFMPSVSIYFPPEYGEQIIDRFGASLPMERIEPDFIDNIVKKIRF